jgi:hypothetical protein
MSTVNEQIQRPIFFSVRKNSSYFTWSPYGEFFNLKAVCIEPLGEDAFVFYAGECLRVQQLGRKHLASATRFRQLKDGIYILAEERGGKYVFRLVRPLREKT